MCELPDPAPEGIKPAVPAAMWPGGPPKFENRDDHFARFLDVRGLYTEELSYRRDRQWEILKWVFASLLVIIGGLLTLKAKSEVHLTFSSTVALTLVILVVGMVGIYRILHDGGVMSMLCDAVYHMDASTGLSMDTRPGKLMARCKAFFLGIQTAPKSPEDAIARAISGHEQAPFWSGLLRVYVILIAILTTGAIVILWSELYTPDKGSHPAEHIQTSHEKGPATENPTSGNANVGPVPPAQGPRQPNTPKDNQKPGADSSPEASEDAAGVKKP